jgi:pyrroloquinoline-quinone synthase
MQTPFTLSLPSDLYLLKHPFYQAWMNGSLPKAALQDYAKQYYHHVEAFPSYLSQASQIQTASAACKAILEDNLAEEDGSRYGTSHPELWLRFAEGVGVPRTDVQAGPYGQGIRKVVKTFTDFSKNSLPEALGALYAYEAQVPEIAGSKIEGLRSHFQVEDERTLAFFQVHQTADIEHRESLKALIDGLSESEKRTAQKAADAACGALWDFLTDVYAPYTEKNSVCSNPSGK